MREIAPMSLAPLLNSVHENLIPWMPKDQQNIFSAINSHKANKVGISQGGNGEETPDV